MKVQGVFVLVFFLKLFNRKHLPKTFYLKKTNNKPNPKNPTDLLCYTVMVAFVPEFWNCGFNQKGVCCFVVVVSCPRPHPV